MYLKETSDSLRHEIQKKGERQSLKITMPHYCGTLINVFTTE